MSRRKVSSTHGRSRGWSSSTQRSRDSRRYSGERPVIRFEAKAMSPEAFGALLRADYEKMARVVKASGARID